MAYRNFIQLSGAKWSQWMEMGKVTQVSCCDCGLVHTWKFAFTNVNPRTKQATLWMKCRKHKARTAERRKQRKFKNVKVAHG